MSTAEDCIQKRALNYEKDGDNHYDTISAFIKSMRGSDPDAALYYLAKMHEERGETDKAKYYAKIILEKKIKVMTPELYRILREMTILNNK